MMTADSKCILLLTVLFFFFFPQIISLFTLVQVQLKADGAPLKYSTVLKRSDVDDMEF